MVPRCAALTALLIAIAPAAPAVALPAWESVTSGTTDTITALEYQGETRAWYGTADGRFGYADESGAFHVSPTSFPGQEIADMDFSWFSPTGFAVSTSGRVFRTTDAGRNWSDLTASLPTVNGSCSGAFFPRAVPRLTAVEWTYSTSVVLVGGGTGPSASEPVVIRSIDATSPSPSFENWGRLPSAPWCKLGTTGEWLSDVFSLPVSANQLTFVAGDGTLWRSPDGLARPVAPFAELRGNAGTAPRIAVDHSASNRVWAIDRGCAGVCFLRSTTGGTDPQPMTIAGPAQLASELNAIDYVTNSVIAVGEDGAILRSTDGTTAVPLPAESPHATTDWRAVSTLDHSHALVGGAGGALIKAVPWVLLPDRQPPTGRVTGPASVPAGSSATFTVVELDDPSPGSGVDPASVTWTSTAVGSGSGPAATIAFPFPGLYAVRAEFKDRAGNVGSASAEVIVTRVGRRPDDSRDPDRRDGGRRDDGRRDPPNASRPMRRSMGGATITVWRRISLARGRNVPVLLTTRRPRRVAIALLGGRRERRPVAQRTIRMRGGATRLVRLALGARVRPGSYRVVVRVFSGRRPAGRALTFPVKVLR